MAGRNADLVQVRSSLREVAAVANASARRDDDAGPAVMHAPAELDVLAVQVDRGVESAEFTEQVGADQQTGRGEHEDVSDTIVLFLVDLAGFDRLVDLAEAVEAEPDALEHARFVPFDEFRAHGAGVRAVQLLDQQAHRVRIRGDVVVAEQEEAVLPLDEPAHLVGGAGETRIGTERTHERVRQTRRDRRLDRLERNSGIRSAIGDQEQETQIGVVLRGERVERRVEPVTWFVNDHDGDDRRCTVSLRFHDVPRLAARPVRDRVTARTRGVASVTPPSTPGAPRCPQRTGPGLVTCADGHVPVGGSHQLRPGTRRKDPA